MEGFEQLADVPDDGYIMQNAGHHLVGAKRLWDLKKLISSPTWLETKLHSYGVASVVADFRRWVCSGVEGTFRLKQALDLLPQ